MDVFHFPDQKRVQRPVGESWQIDIFEGRFHVTVAKFFEVPFFILGTTKKAKELHILVISQK
jgi:hypothetical protein